MKTVLLNQFINKWKAIEQVERQEYINMSLKEKFLKTVSIMRLGIGLGYTIDSNTIKEIKQARQRWVTLKNILK